MSVQPALAPRPWAATAAVAVFVLGYGALTLASALGLGEDSLPGQYTFRAATVGDGVLLPLLAYSLVRAAGHVRERNDRRSVVAAATVGVLAGAAVQAQWLTDPHPTVNWTLPVAGSFNGVGWYHAGFLVAACGFFAGAITAAIARLRREQPGASARIRSVGILCVLTPALGFVALLAEDNGASDVLAVLLWLAPLTVLAICVLIWAVPGTTAMRCTLVSLAALLPALSLSLLFLPGRVSEVLTLLPALCAALAGAAATSSLALGRGPGRVLVPLCSAMCAAGPVYAFTGLPSVTVAQLAGGCAVSVAAVIVELLILRRLLERPGVPLRTVVLTALAGAPVTAYALAGRYFGQEPALIGQYSVIVALAVSVLYLWVSAGPVRSTFNAVISAEQAHSTPEQLSDAKWTAWSAIITTYGGATLSCVVALIGTSADKWVAGSADGWISLAVLAVALAALLAITALSARQVAAVVGPASCLAWSALMVSQLVNGYGDWKQAVLSIVAAVAVTLFVLEGVAGNAGYLHNQPIGHRLLLTAVCAALAAGSTMAWLTGPALWSTAAVTAIYPALTSVLIGIGGCIVLPWLVARTVPGATPPKVYRTTSPEHGVLQDCVMVTLLGMSLAWVPNLFMAHLGDIASWISAAVPFLALLTAAYVNVMKNNIGHVHREHLRVGEVAAQAGTSVPADEQRALDALATHVRRQNRIALVALIPFGLLLLTTEINHFSDDGIRGTFRRITTP